MIMVLDMVNYTLVLLYGILLTVSFAGGCSTARERRVVAFLCIAILIIQTLCWQFFGLTFTLKIYPLIAHLPITLTLVYVLKKPWGITIVSVPTAYFCCQLPRWIGTLFLYLFDSSMAFQISYIISIVPIFFLLHRYFSSAAYKAMTYSTQSLLLFGGLPLFYYFFDYATRVYTNALYSGIRMIAEFLPASMALFYVLFVTVYHGEVQRRNQAELQNSQLAMQFEQAKKDIFAQKRMQEQTAAYRHDMRHHFAMIGGYLKAGEQEKAIEYIKTAENDIELFTPTRFCENTAVNLILSAYSEKAKTLGITFSIEANIPGSLSIPETSICALLSNGLENAVSATVRITDEKQKIVRVNCQLHKDNLLIYIQNPYEGEITLQDNLPKSSRSGHGFGVKSIQMIVDMHGGFCSFDTVGGFFTLKVVLPLNKW